MSFGYKTAWFAVRTEDGEAVASALGLVALAPATAVDAIHAGYHTAGKVFITSAIDGWTLAMSRSFFDLVDDRPPQFLDMLRRVSSELGAEAQFFLTYRVVDAHAWARACRGKIERAYGHLQGDDILNLGAMTAEETVLGHRFFDPACAEAQHDAYWQRDDLRFPDEGDVMEVAARWSIDPSVREDMSNGWLADRSKAPAAAPASPPPPHGKPWWKLW
ncbi:hypothetical protein [Roseateles sp. BYS96W]|uniref:DUF4130 domain-containing protein n=1 Tax=Pelomonas nitida TaxID=3299027 RepID=A0ABW7G143_9BURK